MVLQDILKRVVSLLEATVNNARARDLKKDKTFTVTAVTGPSLLERPRNIRAEVDNTLLRHAIEGVIARVCAGGVCNGEAHHHRQPAHRSGVHATGTHLVSTKDTAKAQKTPGGHTGTRGSGGSSSYYSKTTVEKFVEEVRPLRFSLAVCVRVACVRACVRACVCCARPRAHECA